MATRDSAKASPEQLHYANLLFYGCWTSIFIMIITYVIYVMGLASPHIPLDQLPQLFCLPVREFLAQSGAPHGWGWALLLGKGDYVNFLGIALLALMTIIAFATLIPAYVRQKDIPFLVIVIVEMAVLLLAASGILGGGAH